MGNADYNSETLARVSAGSDSATTMPGQSIGTDMKSGNGDKSDNVRVAIRVRPLNARERANAGDFRFSWNVNSTTITQTLNNKPIAANSYSFDNVFQPPADNSSIFETVASNVVKSTVEGVNGVIFAYGQTAAGKTHTMLGNQQDPGVTPRAISAVFEHLRNTPSRQFLLRAMYIEIYNEVIRDLLVPANDNLKIHEDAINKRVFVDAKEVVVSSVEQVMQIIGAGEEVRAYGETDMNDRSSRSHTIFSLKIESREMTAADARERRRTQGFQPDQDYTNDSDSESDTDDTTNDGVAVRVSTLSLVDLAGSERASFTKAQGVRLVEGGHINKSLLTLGNVINKLSSRESRSIAHIPYRDSKLTRLLQPALGGNARTAIICAVTPAILHMEETLSTLKFASRAMKVTNSAKTNEFLDDRAKLRRAEKVIAMLRAQILANGSSSPQHGGTSTSTHLSPIHSQISTDRVHRFKRMFGRLLDAVNQSGSGSSPTKGPARKRPRLTSKPNSVSALHLITYEKPELDAEELQKASAESCVGRDITVDENEMADLRSRMFEAERQRRQILNEVRYERELMASEVAELIAQIGEITRQRDVAERECGEAIFTVSRATCASIVDETVSVAMDTSFLRSDLQNSHYEISRLNSVSEENCTLQEKLAAVQRDNTELRRRERQGVGPVLKECRQAQSKLADAENKLRSAKQSASSLSCENRRLERELKVGERAAKSLTTRMEQMQKRDESRVQSRIAREVDSVRKAAAAETATLSKSIEKLSEKLAAAYSEKDDVTSQLGEASERLLSITQERDTAREENAELENSIAATGVELSTLRTKHSELKATIAAMEQRLQSSEQTRAETEGKLAQLHEDLDTVHTEMSKINGENATLLIQRRSLSQKVEALEREVEVSKKKVEEIELQAAASFADASQWEARAGMERSRREDEERLRANMEEESVRLRDALKEMDCKVCKAQSDLEEAVRQVEEAKCEASTISTDRLMFQQREREAKSEIRDLHKQTSELQVLLNEANEAIRRTEGEVTNVHAELSKEIDVLTRKAAEDMERATARMTAAEVFISELEPRVAQLNDELSACKSSVEESEMSLAQARIELDKTKASLAQALAKLEAKEMRLRVVETELQRRIAETDEAKKEMRHMQGDNEYLSMKVEEQKQEICRLLEEEIICRQELSDACCKIKNRDEELFENEKRLQEISNGEGEVKLLRERLLRRTRACKDLTEQLSVMRRQLQQESGMDDKAISNLDQLAEAEGKIACLSDENKSLKKQVANYDEETRKCRALLKRMQLKRVELTEQQQDRRIASTRKLLHHYQSSKLFETPLPLVMSTPSEAKILRDHNLNVGQDESGVNNEDDLFGRKRRS